MATEVFEWLVANGYAESVRRRRDLASPSASPRCTPAYARCFRWARRRRAARLTSASMRRAPACGHCIRWTRRRPNTPRPPPRPVRTARRRRPRAPGVASVRLPFPLLQDQHRPVSCELSAESKCSKVGGYELFISRKDMAEALYPQGQSGFHQHRPRIQELDVEGKEFNAQEEAGDLLSDALAPFTTKPKHFAQPSVLLSDIGLKSRKAHVCTTTELNSAIRYFKTEIKFTHTAAPACRLQVATNEICISSLPAMRLFRDFDHATNDQLIGSCTSAPQFCLITDFMLGLHHQHEVGPLKPESDQSVEDYVRNLTDAKKHREEV